MKTVSLLALATIASGVLAAGVPVKSHPSEIEYRPFEFEPPAASDYRYELSNGTTVYMAPSNELPLVTVSFSFKGGSYLEPKNKTGLASMTGQMIRRGGTVSMPASDFDEQVDFLAANIGAFIGDETSGASLNSLSANFDESFELFMDMVRTPGFQEDKFEILRGETLENMKQRNDNADAILAREWNRIMWGEDHYEARVSTKESINSITVSDMRDFHRMIFNPNNLIISVTGDFTANDMLAVLESAVNTWEPGQEMPDPPKPDHEPTPGVYYVQKDIPQGKVRIGHRGIERDHPDYFPVMVMNDILGAGGFTSRILNRVRSDEGLAYGAGSSFQTSPWYPGQFLSSFASKNLTVALATRIIFEEFEKIQNDEVSDEEIRTAKSSFIETFPRNFESKAGMLGIFVNDQWTDRDPNYWRTYRDNVEAVTKADVQTVARKHIDPSKAAILVVGDWDEIYKGNTDTETDPNRQAAMSEFYGGASNEIPLKDPMTQKPIEKKDN